MDALHHTIARNYLDVEVMLEEIHFVLARIKFLCSVIALCLGALTRQPCESVKQLAAATQFLP